MIPRIHIAGNITPAHIINNFLEERSSAMKEPTRHRMPATRPAIVHKTEIDGWEFFITVSFYDDLDTHAHPGEVFVVGASLQSKAVNAAIQAWAMSISMLLQYGTPWEKIYAKYESGDVLTRGIVHAIQCCVNERKRVVGMDEPPTDPDRPVPGSV